MTTLFVKTQKGHSSVSAMKASFTVPRRMLVSIDVSIRKCRKEYFRFSISCHKTPFQYELVLGVWATLWLGLSIGCSSKVEDMFMISEILMKIPSNTISIFSYNLL